ncbi:MAG TPA: hypothetical protein VIE91_05135 [Methylophilaceae bacterium]|jgi:hypothetical protein
MFSLTKPLFLTALLLLWAHSAVWADEPGTDSEYRPGKGWQVPGTGFKLGGYASIGSEDEDIAQRTYGINNLSLFIHWESEGKLRLFSEIALENPAVFQEGRGLTAKHGYLALERLYGDYLYSENLNFRAGKFLTPIGRWNVIHAAPLTWTVNRPLITERTFPTNVTGGMLYGTVPVLGKAVDYSVYSALGEEWRPDPKLDPFEEAYGLHVNLPVTNNGELGLSYANFEQKSSINERKNLLGLDYLWSHNRYEVSMEAVYRFSDNGSQSDEKGLYIQGVAPISERWYAIGRYEFYDQAGPVAATNIWLAGVALRLSPALVLKAEYSRATNNHVQAPNGVYASFSILF